MAFCHTDLVVWFLGRPSLTHCVICSTCSTQIRPYLRRFWNVQMLNTSRAGVLQQVPPKSELGLENADVKWFTPLNKVLRFVNDSVQNLTTKIYWVMVRFLKIRAVVIYFMVNNSPPACVCVYFVDMADRASCTCVSRVWRFSRQVLIDNGLVLWSVTSWIVLGRNSISLR